MFLTKLNVVGYVAPKIIGSRTANFVLPSPLVNPKVQGEEMVRAVEFPIPTQLHRMVPQRWVEKLVQLQR